MVDGVGRAYVWADQLSSRFGSKDKMATTQDKREDLEEDKMATTQEERANMAWCTPPWDEVHKEERGARRWTVGVYTVVRHRETGKLWAIEWERALTEEQESDFPNEPFEVEAYEKKVPAHTVTRYRPKQPGK